MATVQNIADLVSQDIRKMLDSTVAGDQAVLIDYTNRVHLDILRDARWRFLISAVLQFSTVLGKSDYWIGATGGATGSQIDTLLNITDLGALKHGTVFDRTGNKRLGKTDEQPLGAAFASNGRPVVYRHDAATPSVLNIYPPLDGVYTIEFRYFKAKKQLTALSDVLLIPDDYKDVVTAGVNALANLYLRQSKDDAQFWSQIYEKGKQGMHRDRNMFPRGGEFISPDPASQVRGPIIPLGLDSGIESSLF